MTKEVAFGPNHWNAHQLPPEGAFSLASNVHQRKQTQDLENERQREKDRGREIWFASPFITIHWRKGLAQIPRSGICWWGREKKWKRGSWREWLAEWKEGRRRGPGKEERKEMKRVEQRMDWWGKRGRVRDNVPDQINAACWRPQEQSGVQRCRVN